MNASRKGEQNMSAQALKKVLIMPEEAHRIASRYRTVLDYYNIVPIIDYCDRVYAKMPDQFFVRMVKLTTIWNAGRIQGIREERQRRRKVPLHIEIHAERED
jgi:hypothetical protein